MRDLRYSLCTSSAADVEEEDSAKLVETDVPRKAERDMTPIENSPKIDAQLLAKYERLIAASKGFIRVKRGANYRLSHPLGSNDVPPDPRLRGKRQSKVKKP